MQQNGDGSEDKADGESAFALVIGNSKALWRPFQLHLKGLDGQQQDPLNNYTEEHVNAAVQAACAATSVTLDKTQVYFAHLSTRGKIVAIQV